MKSIYDTLIDKLNTNELYNDEYEKLYKKYDLIDRLFYVMGKYNFYDYKVVGNTYIHENDFILSISYMDDNSIYVYDINKINNTVKIHYIYDNSQMDIKNIDNYYKKKKTEQKRINYNKLATSNSIYIITEHKINKHTLLLLQDNNNKENEDVLRKLFPKEYYPIQNNSFYFVEKFLYLYNFDKSVPKRFLPLSYIYENDGITIYSSVNQYRCQTSVSIRSRFELTDNINIDELKKAILIAISKNINNIKEYQFYKFEFNNILITQDIINVINKLSNNVSIFFTECQFDDNVYLNFPEFYKVFFSYCNINLSLLNNLKCNLFFNTTNINIDRITYNYSENISLDGCNINYKLLFLKLINEKLKKLEIKKRIFEPNDLVFFNGYNNLESLIVEGHSYYNTSKRIYDAILVKNSRKYDSLNLSNIDSINEKLLEDKKNYEDTLIVRTRKEKMEFPPFI